MNQPLGTLLGGRSATVLHMDGNIEEIKINQLPLGDWERGFKVLDDEFALTALLCGHEKTWIYTLQPDCFEKLRLAAREVNAKGFFSHAERRQTLQKQRHEEELAMIAKLPVETAKLVLESGQAILNAQSSGSAPRPG